MFTRWFAIPLAFLAMAGGCGGTSSAHVPTKGTVAGIFVVAGGPAPGTSQPTPGVITFAASDGRETNMTVGRKGVFKVQLPEGSYSVSGHSPLIGDGSYLCTGGAVQVSIESAARVRVVCPIP